MINSMNGVGVALQFPSDDEVLGQWCDFRAAWWEKYVPAEIWPDTLKRLPPSDHRRGYQRITRRDVFALASNDTPRGRVGLLLGAYIWGTGPSAFFVGRRARTFTRTDIDTIGQRLRAADRLLADTGPSAAYASLTRGAANSIPFLGPAFFTKYLYFVAGHRTDVSPAPLILDRKVARALRKTSPDWLLGNTGWSSDTYGRYLAYANDLAATHQISPGAVELALFRN
ncbi:hypothetical protein [Modestobacter sp. Leaf380]|uniref:8-oxoguanine DNA glycosylase OGG fold protein n=1 Tax=Modestobacter sp. Leaf380 TaxID=1736356 RepID=UPI0006FA6BAE|nr:hypothetical protein [Modestobacter sp. Leaf380]KQS69835.1 hypothetical protein ASG41_21290 [Modestobacter sp. Leaf380]